jgi:hypothetical protein
MLDKYIVQVYPLGEHIPYSVYYMAEDANHALEQYNDDPFGISPIVRIDVYKVEV